MFIGREEELNQLDSLWNKVTKTSLVTVRGRRRIGKSTLIERFAGKSGARFLKVEGLSPKTARSNQDQLKAFYSQLQLQTGKVYEVKDWLKAFSDLDASIQDDRRMVVLLDEISWMGRYDKNFPGLLKIAWDNLFHRHENLILFLCGSVSSWIRENILENAGFLGRPSADIVLKELPVKDCLAFWGGAGRRLSSREFFDMLSVTGGVPRYLEEINPALSVDESIRQSCFSPSGYLFKDFDLMFDEIYDDGARDRKDVLKVLADRPMTVSEIANAIKRPRNGHVADLVKDLVQAGFLIAERGNNPATGGIRQEIRYRIGDNYVRFYLHFLAPRRSMIEDGSYRFDSLEQLPGWDGVLGLQFENLVLGALPLLVRHLHLEKTRVLSMAPFRKSSRDSERGCQIDCLIQTKRSLYVVEIKRKSEIGMEIVNEVEQKIARLPYDGKLSVRPVLVYDGHLSPSVVEENYFTSIIPATELFGVTLNANG